jgi:glycosyltransferase involved in cell wall biosynthesis
MTIAVISMIRDNWGGSEELWYDMAMVAMREGHTVVHLSYEVKERHAKMDELIQRGLIAYQRPGYIRPGSNPVSRFLQMSINFIRKKIKDPFRQVAKHRPDVIVYNGTCYSIAKEAALLAYVEKNKSRFYIIGHLNSDLERPAGKHGVNMISSAYDLCRKVFFVSAAGIRMAERHLCKTITNAAIIRNPVNLADTSIVHFPELLASMVNFAMVGNLVVIHKGQDILLAILAQQEWRNRNWQLNIYGSGIDEDYLHKLVQFYDLSEKVVFHGRVNDIKKVWQQNHILLMPSRMEGMPLAVVEAMLSGRPCVAADAGGITEWVTDDETGFIAEAATVYSFGKAMERAWARQTAWKTMGAKAHERAMRLYEPQAGKKLLNLIAGE